ncbi:aroF leader peptide [Actinoplanes sp. SE50/110]|nr:aroF leader peptide [Actinoplanes sp. SE50/110]
MTQTSAFYWFTGPARAGASAMTA